MKPKLTSTLSKEHQKIMEMVEILEKICLCMEQKKKIRKSSLQKAVYFIQNYADRIHHVKEEKILFKEVCQGDVRKWASCSPVQQMLYEHDLGRGFVRQMEKGISLSNKQEFVKGARGYSQLLNEHIFKEDNIFYPMAEEEIKEEKIAGLCQQFAEADKPNQKVREKCLAFLEELKKEVR